MGCGTDTVENDQVLCIRCVTELPYTDFAHDVNNPVEKLFWGRIPVKAGTSEFYFAKGNCIQTLIHELKYRKNKEAGRFLGRLMAKRIEGSKRFNGIDALIPLPISARKERVRGYNQAEVICDVMSGVMDIPVVTGVVSREKQTESQTMKRRKERWQNVEGSFVVSNASALRDKHVLLVDDVITTGATIEACASEILKVPGVTLSIAAAAFASH